SAARTATIPISVTVLSAKRPNGWMPTPAISTSSAIGDLVGRKRVTDHLPAFVVDVKRRNDDAHRHPEPQMVETGFADPADETDACGQLDDAEAERQLAAVSGRPVDDHRIKEERPALAEQFFAAIGGRAVRAARQPREVVPPARRARAADQPGSFGPFDE